MHKKNKEARRQTCQEIEEISMENEVRFRELFNHTNSGVAIYEAVTNGEDFISRDFNKAAERIEGIAKEDVIGRSVLEVFPGIKEFGLFQVLQRVWRTGKPENYPINFYTDKRINGWRENSIYKLPTGEVMAIYDDFTERKRTEEALKSTEANLKLAIESTGLGLFDFYPLTEKLIWSDSCKIHYGLPLDSEGGYDLFLAALHPDDRERVLHTLEDASKPESGGEFSTEYRTIGIQDGKERWLAVRGQVFFNEEKVAVRLFGVCLDITKSLKVEQSLREQVNMRLQAVEKLRKQEQLLIQQGRFAAMGEMIGNIAHQWRQPLNTLGLIVQELPLCYEQSSFTKEYLETSVDKAMQVILFMSQTIDDFRNFFKTDKKVVSFKAKEVVEKTISIVEAAFTALKLEIETIAEDDISILGCPNEFTQLILNILTNSKDAFLEHKVDHPRILLKLFREKDKSVLIITDNAGGIPEDIMDKIFDPYFTTKGPDLGTGIGLFMSKIIISNMKGTLSVRNTGDGAEFRIEV